MATQKGQSSPPRARPMTVDNTLYDKIEFIVKDAAVDVAQGKQSTLDRFMVKRPKSSGYSQLKEEKRSPVGEQTTLDRFMRKGPSYGACTPCVNGTRVACAELGGSIFSPDGVASHVSAARPVPAPLDKSPDDSMGEVFTLEEFLSFSRRR